MNTTQIGGVARWAIGALVAYLVGAGLIPEGISGDVIAGSTLIAVGIWSWYTNKTTVMVQAVAKEPEVQKVVMTSTKVADTFPETNVVGPSGATTVKP